MFVLDTTVISELRQGKRNQSMQVRSWAQSQSVSQLFITAITVLELERGVITLERRNPPQGATLRSWLSEVRTAFEGRVLVFNDHTATLCAALHFPNPQSERDAMIAATAMEHGFAVVTRNTSDFIATGVALINPWD